LRKETNKGVEMITTIGIVAGEIWHVLEQQKQIALEEILQQLDHKKDIILMSIGWLAREGHVVLDCDDANECRIRLREKQSDES